MLDKATVLTTIFTIVDDAMKGSSVIQKILNRPGPVPKLSDSEVVTIALYQELIGELFPSVSAATAPLFSRIERTQSLQPSQTRSLVGDPSRAYDAANRLRCAPLGRDSSHRLSSRTLREL